MRGHAIMRIARRLGSKPLLLEPAILYWYSNSDFFRMYIRGVDLLRKEKQETDIENFHTLKIIAREHQQGREAQVTWTAKERVSSLCFSQQIFLKLARAAQASATSMG